MRSLSRILAILVMLEFISAVGLGVQKFKTISVPGSTSTVLYGINDSNIITGSYVDSNDARHGMILAGDGLTTIDDPNGTETSCTGINKSGTVVGNYAEGSNFVGFVYQDGTFTDVVPFGGVGSYVNGINDDGVMVGQYQDPKGETFGFYGRLGSYESFQVPGSTFTSGHGINNAGLIVALWVDSHGRYESSLFNPAKRTNAFLKINVPGAQDTVATSISNRQQISFGWSNLTGSYGAVMANGKFMTFNAPNGSNTTANGINDNGVIVGQFLPANQPTLQGFEMRQ